MSTGKFIGLLIVLAIVYNAVVIYLYYKPELKKIFGKSSEEKQNPKQVKRKDISNESQRSLVGATRENDLDYIPKKEAIQINEIEVHAEKINTVSDNSFSTEDIEKAMENLNDAIETEKETADFGHDLFSQISKSGSLKVGIKKGNQIIDRNMMVLENTIVI